MPPRCGDGTSGRIALVLIQPDDVLQNIVIGVQEIQPPLRARDFVGAVQDGDVVLLQNADRLIHVLRLKAQMGAVGPLGHDRLIGGVDGLDQLQAGAIIGEKGPLLPKLLRAAVKQELEPQLLCIEANGVLQIPHAERAVVIGHDNFPFPNFNLCIAGNHDTISRGPPQQPDHPYPVPPS